MKLPATVTKPIDKQDFMIPEIDKDNEMKWRGKVCSSVLKKRRSKMNKHKYKKQRKKYKFLRRALGK